MIKTLKNSLPLLLTTAIATSLTACGLAEPTDPLDDNADNTNPIMIKSVPTNKGTLTASTSAISLELSETINLSTLGVLNNLEVTSLNNEAIDGVWTFEEATDEDGEPTYHLIFTLTDRASIPAGQQFKIDINGQITDAANNPLLTTVEFSTPGLFDIDLTAEGLLDGEDLIVTQGDKSVTINTNNQTFTIDSDLINNAAYSLSISQQAATSFCSLSSSAGAIQNNNPSLTIKCHNVKPVYATASNWNQYYKIDDATWVHGGELRNVKLPNISNNCNETYAQDSAKAFNWVCSIDSDGIIQFTSTGLQAGKGLSDLIAFGAVPNWKLMKLTVFGSADSRALGNTTEGIWWNNPMSSVTSSTPISLPNAGTIYLIQEGSPNTTRREIKNSGIALVIEPGFSYLPNSIDAAISVVSADSNPEDNSWQNNGTWIEGNIDAASSHTGIKIESSIAAVINKVNIKNADGNGIEISSSRLTKILSTQTSNNDASGLFINRPNDNYGSLVKNTQSTNNGSTGIALKGSDITLFNVSAANNDTNGIEIYGYGHKFSNVSSSNNRLDGIVLLGARNNIITSSTISSNGANGLRFSASGVSNSKNNLLNSVSIINNMSSAVEFDANALGNSLLNVLDAYNAPSICPETSCDNFTTVTIDTMPTADLFSIVESDSIITTYDPAKSIHFANATLSNVFQNQFRAWGNRNAITNESGSGSCNHIDEANGENICTMFDWSLSVINEATALNQLTLDTMASEHTFISTTEATSFLKTSIEILGDNIGNDNGLCETDENCIFTPNVGSYQGHGDLTSLDNTSEVTATLFQYDQNGR